MCEMLIRLTDPGTGKATRIQPGDVIEIRDDGFSWARRESFDVWVAQGNDPADWHNNTVLIKMPGENKEDWYFLMEEETADENDPDAPVTKRRKKYVDITALINVPDDRVATVASALFQAQVKDR